MRNRVVGIRGFVFGPGWSRRIGLYAILMISLAAILAPILTPYSPTRSVDGASPLQAPSGDHLFGTDQLARDVFTRVLYAAQIDLQIGLIGVCISLLIGVPIGLVAGYLGGWPDTVIGRIIDIAVAFPPLVLIIAVVAMLGPGLTSFYIAVAIVGWVAYARIIRGEVLAAKRQEYVLASRGLGFRPRRIVFRHVLPNVLAPAVAFAMSDFLLIILLAASLGFFGLGVPAPTPEWGRMIAENRNFVVTAPWVVAFPGLAIVLVGFFVSLLGDGLADWVRRVDPR